MFAVVSPSWADGFIVVDRPVDVPIGHYKFAPLQVVYHDVVVSVKGQVAVTKIDQEFYNSNNSRLEGHYIFPVPEGAHVSNFKMDINGVQTEAELLSADKARQIYENIVRNMQDPALMEYAGRSLYKVRIFPIEPKSHKKISIMYSQVLKRDGALINYVYPLNTEKFSSGPIKRVTIKTSIETEGPIKSVYSPSHTITVKRESDNRAVAKYESFNERPDSDFQLIYAEDKQPVSIQFMTHRTSGDEGYFMMMASPGIGSTTKKVLPKDVVFVADTSGSMAGAKLAQEKKALVFCLENLNEDDRFEVIRFSTESEPLFRELKKSSSENRAKAVEFVQGFKPIGGTGISDALKTALALKPSNSQRPFVIIFLTDGKPTVGELKAGDIVRMVPLKNQGLARIFCFGIGTDVNTQLLDSLASVGRGASQYVLPDEDLEVKLSSFFTKIKDPVLADLKLSMKGDVRITQYYPSPLPDLFKNDQLILFGKYKGFGKTVVSLAGRAGGEEIVVSSEFDADSRQGNSVNEFIPRLWAVRRVGFLLEEIHLKGENSELRDEVTLLAREFGIVTPYTSYLIVEDERQRNVPAGSQTMRSLAPSTAAPMMESGRGFTKDKEGLSAVAAADSVQEFKSYQNTLDSVSKSQSRVNRAAINGSAGVLNKAEASEKIRTLSRRAGGRAFYLSGETWIDSELQKESHLSRTKIQFNSEEYFNLARQSDVLSRILAVGPRVQFLHAGKIIEITK